MVANGEQAVYVIINSLKRGGKLLLCGNGGSAADCSHITGELAKGFLKRRPLSSALCEQIGQPWASQLQNALSAIDLTANNALIAAIINDLDGANVYAQQVMAYGREGDVLLGISPSGNAQNVYRAAVTAKARGLKTVAMTGMGGGMLAEVCDVTVMANEKETYKVQEEHLRFYHQMCMQIEDAFFHE